MLIFFIFLNMFGINKLAATNFSVRKVHCKSLYGSGFKNTLYINWIISTSMSLIVWKKYHRNQTFCFLYITHITGTYDNILHKKLYIVERKKLGTTGNVPSTAETSLSLRF